MKFFPEYSLTNRLRFAYLLCAGVLLMIAVIIHEEHMEFFFLVCIQVAVGCLVMFSPENDGNERANFSNPKTTRQKLPWEP